jgi:hypothetical protein
VERFAACSSNPPKKSTLFNIQLLTSWMLMAHACNPKYSGGKNQEDRGWMPAWTNSSRNPPLKKTHHKKGLEE